MKSNSIFLLFILATLLNYIDGGALPSYIDVCKRSDPNLNSCAMTSASKVMAALVHGDKRLKIPPLDPLILKQLVLNSGNLKLTFNDVEATGIKNSIVKKVEIDSTGTKWDLGLLVPTLTLLTNYEVDGRILVLPITGSGPGNFTFSDILLEMPVELEIVEKDGSKFGTIKSSEVSYKATKLAIQMDNLFGGDPALGGEMLTFLNENWEEVNKEMAPAISKVLNTVISSLFNNLFGSIPFEEMIPS